MNNKPATGTREWASRNENLIKGCSSFEFGKISYVTGI